MGYESEFYSTRQIYYDHDGLTYWHMGNIINRCPESETYRRRKAEGRLPEDLKEGQDLENSADVGIPIWTNSSPPGRFLIYSMKPRIYERHFLSASLYELFHGRLPSFRGRAAVRNLARLGIKASFERHNDNFVRVRACATTEKHVNYLEIRGYQKKNPKKTKEIKLQSTYSDVVRTILARAKTGDGGIPLTRGEVAMLFLDGYAGDGPNLLDIRSQGYGDDSHWDGLTIEDVLEDTDTAFVWEKWEPLELWPDELWEKRR